MVGFMSACTGGLLEFAQWMHSSFALDLTQLVKVRVLYVCMYILVPRSICQVSRVMCFCEQGKSVLHSACMGGQLNVVRWLVSASGGYIPLKNEVCVCVCA